MAFSAVWIAVASLLAAFDIEKAVDENGNVVDPTHEYISALVTCAMFSLLYAYFTSQLSLKSGCRNPLNVQSDLAQRKQRPSYALLRAKKSFDSLFVSSTSNKYDPSM